MSSLVAHVVGVGRWWSLLEACVVVVQGQGVGGPVPHEGGRPLPHAVAAQDHHEDGDHAADCHGDRSQVEVEVVVPRGDNRVLVMAGGFRDGQHFRGVVLAGPLLLGAAVEVTLVSDAEASHVEVDVAGWDAGC